MSAVAINIQNVQKTVTSGVLDGQYLSNGFRQRAPRRLAIGIARATVVALVPYPSITK